MGRAVLTFSPVIFFLLAMGTVWAGQRPPAPPPGPNAANHVADIRRKLKSTKPVDVTAQRALQYSHAYLGSAEDSLRAGRAFEADRLAAAADALLHIAEHQQHLRTGGGPKGPPPPAAIQDHLQRVYFRTQQAEFFLHQSHNREAASFPKWAGDFYQLAVRAYERKDWVAADENAKCADEVVKALENLAQAVSPATVPPPPPPPPGPPAP